MARAVFALLQELNFSFEFCAGSALEEGIVLLSCMSLFLLDAERRSLLIRKLRFQKIFLVLRVGISILVIVMPQKWRPSLGFLLG